MKHQRKISRVLSQLVSVNEPKNDIILLNHLVSTVFVDEPSILLEGKGSYELHGHWLLLQQFIAILIKRFHYITRNWKGLFSQIILPALFICTAMTVSIILPVLFMCTAMTVSIILPVLFICTAMTVSIKLPALFMCTV